MKHVRILVTSTGGALAPLNIKLLQGSRRFQVWVFAVDVRADAAGRYFADGFDVVPAGDDPAYPDHIARLVADNGIDLVLPWSDEEALALAAARDRIEKAGAKLACAPSETLRIMNDKAASFELLEKAGVRVPLWYRVDSRDELLERIDEVAREGGGEFVVKPLVARGNRGTYVIRTDVSGAEPYMGSRELHMDRDTFEREWLDETVRSLPAMVMERLFPPAYDIDVLARDGELLRAMPRRRVNPAGVPFTGGVLTPDPKLLQLADAVTECLSLTWLYDYDIMTGRDGEPVVIEINPRPSGSIAAAILAGVPFYDDLFALAAGETIEEVEMPGPVAVVPYMDCRIVPVEDLA